VNLNHILLFLAVISSLLVLARAWRPGAPYYGWRIAPVVVLSVTGIAWLFWRGAAGYIGGGAWFVLLFLPVLGLRKMTDFAAQGDYESARKLGTGLQILHPTNELRNQIQLFRQLESQVNHSAEFHSVPVARRTARRTRHSQLRSAPAVLIFILLNVVAFLFEISVGDWNDPEILHRIGALDPYSIVVRHEYWRFLTALFLHGGFIHLLFNIFALYLLGPPLERSIGTTQFAVCYMVSGLASGAGVVGLTLMGVVQPAQLIGASGSIMGIVGAWAGFLLRHRHALHAKQRLANIAVIIGIQIAFDLSTPQVSMSAHLCGLVAGFFLGLLLARRAVAGVDDPGRNHTPQNFNHGLHR
jgi:membrane associated rhomboid family serine protease